MGPTGLNDQRRSGAGQAGRRTARTGILMLMMALGAVALAACVPPDPPGPTTTTTTSSTTTTTTTTTTVPEPPEGDDLAFTQTSTMLTEPGQSIDLELNGELPEGTTFDVVGDANLFDVTELETGGLRVTADGEVGGIVIAVRTPDQVLATTTEVFTAEPQEDVTVVADAEVVFPVPNLPTHIDITEHRDDLVTDDGPGPFTWAEVVERVEIPSEDDESDESDEGDEGEIDLIDPGPSYLPFVLHGAAPAPGTKLLGTGGSGLGGVVVERTGLPSIDRGGYSLVTVETLGLPELYAEVHWAIDHDELVAAGIMPESIGFDFTCPEDATPAECDDLTDTPVVITVAGESETQGRPASSGTDGDAPVDLPMNTTMSLRSTTPAGCKAQWTAPILNLKFVQAHLQVKPHVDPIFKLSVADPSDNRIRLVVGYDVQANAGITGQVRAALASSLECVVRDLGAMDLPVPLGPAASALSVRLKVQLYGAMSIALEGGPEVPFELGCHASHTFRYGFDITSNPDTGPLSEVETVYENEPDWGCERKMPSGLGAASTAGVSAKVEIGGGFGLKLPIGFQVGGALGGRWASVLGKPDLGFFDVANVTNGPRATVVLENDHRVLANRAAGSRAALEGNLAGELGSKALTSVAKSLGVDPKRLQKVLNITLFDLTNPVHSYYEPVSVGPGHQIDLTVDGEPQSGNFVELLPDSTLGVDTKFPVPTEGPTPVVESGALWVDAVGAVLFKKIPDVELRASGMSLRGDVTIDEDLCELLGEDGREVMIVGQTVFDENIHGPGRTAPAWGGRFTAKCKDPGLEFDRETVAFRADQVNYPATVNLTATRLGGEEWNLLGIPDWLNAEPSSGRFTAEDEVTQPITLTVDCDAVDDEKVRGELVALSQPDGETHDATLEVEADCRSEFIDPNPMVVRAGAGGGTFTVTLETFGPTLVWAETSGGDWATAELTDGVLVRGYSETTAVVTVPPREPTCKRGTARSTTVNVTTSPREDGDTKARGSTSFQVLQAAPATKKKEDCPDPYTAGAWGDPHMVTFDGLRYDAQTFGEYLYTVGGENGPDLEVQARHQRWRQSGFGSTATIITGVAAHVDGHRFEWYSRSDTAPMTKVKIDGETVVLDDGVPVQVGDEVSIVQSGLTWHVSGAESSLEVRRDAGEDSMTLWISLPEGSDVTGLVGTPDGNPDNDMRTRDGTEYTLRQMRLHGLQLVDLADSWRITDPAESLFSETYGGFDDTITLFDPALLETKRGEAAEHLEGIEVICDLPDGDDYDYVVDSIAVELLADTPLELLRQATCTYQVRGEATSTLPDGEVVPVAGLEVEFGSDRLDSCTAVTAADGSYTCTLHPRMPADLPAEGGAPVELDLVASWPARSGTVMDTTVSVEQFAALGGSAEMVEQDLDVDPAQLVGADVSGTLRADFTGDGLEPVSTDVPFILVAKDADGEVLVELRHVAAPATDGSYSFTRYLPGGTSTVEVTAQVGQHADNWVTRSHEVQTGANDVTYSVAQQPPLAELTGTLVRADDTPLERTRFRVHVHDDEQMEVAYFGDLWITPGTDGSYRRVVPLPSTTSTLRVVAEVGVVTSDHMEVRVTDIEPGLNAAVLSTVYDPPVLRVSGTLLDADGVALDTTRLRALARSDEGIPLSTIQQEVTPESDGSYSVDIVLPVASATAVLTAEIGVNAADRPSFEVPTLSAGINEVDLSFADDPPYLTVSGLLLDGNGAPRDRTDIRVRAYQGDDLLHTAVSTVTPDSGTGQYLMEDLRLPFATDRVELAYQVGPTEPDWIVLEVSPVHSGENQRVFDIDLRSTTVLVEGTATGVAGMPMGTFTARVMAYDGDQSLGSWARNVTPAPLTGAYGILVEVPRTTTRVVVRAETGLGQYDWTTTESDGIKPGLNQVRLDVEFTPPWIDVRGTMTGINPNTGVHEPMTGTRTLRIVSRDAHGALLHQRDYTAGLNPADGSYSVPVQLPTPTTSVTVTALIGETTAEWPTSTLDGVEPGTRSDVVLDVDYLPTVIRTSGTIHLGGAPYRGQVRIQVVEFDGDTTLTNRSVTEITDHNGAYSSRRILFLASNRAVVTVTPVGAAAEAVSTEVTDLEPGFRDVALSIDATETRLRAQGYLEIFGEAQDGPIPVRVHTYGSDGADLEPGGRVVQFHANGSNHGRYDETIELHDDAASVVLVVEVDEPDGTALLASPSIPVVPGVTNSTSFNTHGAYVEVDYTFTDAGQPRTEPVQVRSRAYDANDRFGNPVTQTLYPGPDGRATLQRFVPYQSVAGGSTADPVRLEIELTGDTETIVANVALDDPRSYRSSATVELSTALRPTTVVVPRDADEQLTFRSYRLPSADENSSFEVLSEVTVDGQELDDAWDGSAYVLDVPVSPNATHLRVDAALHGISRIVELDGESTPVELTIASGPVEVIVTGTMKTDPSSCWSSPNRPVASRLGLWGLETDPADPEEPTFRGLDHQWVIPEDDGTYTFRTWIDPSGLEGIDVQLDSDGLWWLSASTARVSVDLDGWELGQPIEVDADLDAGCPIFW